MKKIISAMAITAGLAAGLMGGAQAQTITGVNAGGTTIYTADLNKSNVGFSPTPYYYNYVVTLDTITPGTNVNTFTFNFGPTEPVTYVSSPGYTEASTTPGAFDFGAATGLTAVGQTATFTFYSPDPPVGFVSTASTSSGTKAGGGTSTIGPGTCNCPAVPEPASVALLGLGALPLGFLARRRMAAK